MSATDNLSLPYIMPSQAQKHVTHNEALAILDALVQLSVVSDRLSEPPADPAPGDRYIVPAGAGGAWEGREGALVAYRDGAWLFFEPRVGWSAYVEAGGRHVIHDGAGWKSQDGGVSGEVEHLGINTLADALARLQVRSGTVLFAHETGGDASGDVRVAVSKAEPDATASLIFQDGFSGRAEFGLAGSNDFSIKTSADGAEWSEALRVSSVDGSVTVPVALQLAEGARIVSAVSAGTRSGAEIIGGGDLGPVSLRIVNESSLGVAGALFEQRSPLGLDADLVDFAFRTVTSQINLRVEARPSTVESGGTPELQFHELRGETILPLFNLSAVQALFRTPAAPMRAMMATLPTGAPLKAGSLVYVSDAPGGGALAFWDGSHWRTVHDRSVLQ